MKIEFVHIHNFRKLKSCRIDLADKETVFVGANNSGKTSAMDAMITFFKSKDLTTRDFTLSNWASINKLCEEWENESDPTKRDRTTQKWEEYLPTIDIWLSVNKTELHYVTHLIPTLSWKGGALGVRLRYQPKDLNNLCDEYCIERTNSKNLSASGSKGKYKFWPKDMWEYLDKDKMLTTHFEIKAYLLDPALKDAQAPQVLPENSEPLQESAFNSLVKVDIINAQRGFSDVSSEAADTSKVKNLSTQLRLYYEKHLNPTLKPTASDVTALEAIEDAKKLFDVNLQESFKASLGELENLNYPGFGNPTIKLSSQFSAVEMINHEAAVYYQLAQDLPFSLPEKYNGLGYQNLISMIFKLIRFRDEWMQVGKGIKNTGGVKSEAEFEPLQLILIEEPEAHLHAQVQQVFIKEAYKVLRNNPNLKDNKVFTTQLVISTHSNHIAHEIDFTSLRYFKRVPQAQGSIATSTVVNLSKTFGNEEDTTKFAIRYLKTTHCDLFFADAVILVEGPAEKMLVPYFIKKHTKLNACYISILEIGGSHAHKLRPLIESLELITLVITDIDAINPEANNSKVQPERGKKYQSRNDTLKKWLPAESDLDTLLDLPEEKKKSKELPIKIAYQIPITIQEGSQNVLAYPYTFEDCIVFENRDIFSKIQKSTGLLKKMVTAAGEKNIIKCGKEMFNAITTTGAKKAEFALELLYLQEPSVLTTPIYISQGLDWLEKKLSANKQGFPTEKIK